MYDQIISDPYFKHIYDKIEVNYLANHVMPVVNITKSILTQLDFDKKTLENAMIVAFMHDIGKVKKKKKYITESHEKAKNYFIKNQIDTGSNNEILEAIEYHDVGVEHNFISNIVMFADYIDNNFSTLKIKGIENVEVKISDEYIILNFTIKDLDIDKWNNYIESTNLLNVLYKFAKIINRVPNIYLNNKKWDKDIFPE